MHLTVGEVSEGKSTSKGEKYYPGKAGGQLYYFNEPVSVGDVLDCEVRESSYNRNGKTMTSRWAKVLSKAKPASSGANIKSGDYIAAMKVFHTVASELEPEDPQARARILNTALIAFTNGKIDMSDEEDVPPPDDSDDVPF